MTCTLRLALKRSWMCSNDQRAWMEGNCQKGGSVHRISAFDSDPDEWVDTFPLEILRGHSGHGSHQIGGSSLPGCSTNWTVFIYVCAIECCKQVDKNLSLSDRLVVQGNRHGLPSSHLASPESLCRFHQTNPYLSSLCTNERHQMFSVWLTSGYPVGCEESLQGGVISLRWRSAWNFAFTSSRHWLTTLGFFPVFVFFVNLGMNFC